MNGLARVCEAQVAGVKGRKKVREEKDVITRVKEGCGGKGTSSPTDISVFCDESN